MCIFSQKSHLRPWPRSVWDVVSCSLTALAISAVSELYILAARPHSLNVQCTDTAVFSENVDGLTVDRMYSTEECTVYILPASPHSPQHDSYNFYASPTGLAIAHSL